MTLANNTATRSSGFGRRGAAPAHGPHAQPVRRPTISPRPETRAQEAVAEAARAMSTDVTTATSRGRAYATACLAGTAAFVAALFALTGVDNRFFQAGPALIVFALPAVPTLALILYIPTVMLSDLARLLRIPRGWADIGIGLALGIGLGIAMVMSSQPGEEQKTLLTALALAAGGFVAGFAFWRAQGYPGTVTGTGAALDEIYKKIS